MILDRSENCQTVCTDPEWLSYWPIRFPNPPSNETIKNSTNTEDKTDLSEKLLKSTTTSVKTAKPENTSTRTDESLIQRRSTIENKPTSELTINRTVVTKSINSKPKKVTKESEHKLKG